MRWFDQHSPRLLPRLLADLQRQNRLSFFLVWVVSGILIPGIVCIRPRRCGSCKETDQRCRNQSAATVP